MQKRIRLVTGLILIWYFHSCTNNSFNYEVEINKELWKTEPITVNEYFDGKYLNDGNLYIHFQSTYKNDSAEIRINDKLYGKYFLITDWSTELAEVIIMPNFETIKTVEISINDGKGATFKVGDTNQIIVRLIGDKLLIGFRKHVPYYD